MYKYFVIYLLLLVLKFGNSEICPVSCVCKKSKVQPASLSASSSSAILTSTTSTGVASATDLFRAQCGGAQNRITALEDIDFTIFAENMGQLDLSSNLLTTLPPIFNFPFLQKLDLSKNKLTTLDPNIFKDLPNLRRLDLSNNGLKTIQKDWLNGLIKLEKLKLNFNQITTIVRGTFDNLGYLKQLDISNNPLTCDCELLWLLDWLQNTSVKFTTPPKCATPASFKGQLLRKLKVGVEIHCRSPVSTNRRDQFQIELKPNTNQVTYEGDNIKIRCRAPGVTSDTFFDEDQPGSTSMDELPYSSKARIHWRFNLEDPNEKFREIKVENRYLDDSGMLDSVLNIGIISRNHTGQWTCHLVSEKGNYSKSISLFVISNGTKYCPSIVTNNNKGTYVWPRTMLDTLVEQQCQGQPYGGLYHIAYVQQYCSEIGTWVGLNTTACPYISDITKILEQFSKVNLNLTKGNLLESIKHLKNYTNDVKLLKDKMDIVFIARTIQNYLYFVKTERDLGGILLDIVSGLMSINKILMQEAQIEDQACQRVIKAVENLAEFTPSPQSLKFNLAVEDFRVKPENFNGITCTWYTNAGNHRSNRAGKPFFCRTSTDLPYMIFEDEVIETSIQIPASLFTQLEKQGISMATTFQLIIAMYEDNKFFPTYQMKEVITSSVVGATLVDMVVKDLDEPVTVIYRYPLLQDVETPSLGWWDINQNNGIGGWNKNGCELSHYFHENLIFSCDRLSYFGMLQDIQFVTLTSNNNFITGAKFHYSHPAIYIGTFILILCLFLTILTYLLCFSSIQMAKRAKHSLINTWMAIAFTSYIFTFGIYQTEDIQVCQIVGIILHYLSLSVLLWMCVSVTTMYKRLAKSVTLPEELPSTEPPLQKPILGLYLVGWGIALIVCGISGAVNMREYASHAYCFLYTGPALSAIFVPGLILIVFIIICSLMIRCAIRCQDVHGQLSEGTQATENVDLDLLEPNLLHQIDHHSFRSITTASSNIEDSEHCPSKQLKAHIIVLIFYLLVWFSAALTARRVFKSILPYDERIFSILYGIFASMLGAFILFFYGIARSDVRSKWGYVKRIWCRTRSISDTNTQQPLTPIQAPSISGLTVDQMQCNNSRSSSRTSSHTKSLNSNMILKAAVDLNNVNNDPEAEAKIANVNLVVLHRQQYRTNNTIPVYENNTNNVAQMFYNPHQSTVARKFFKKQRKNMIKHNNLGTKHRMHRIPDCDEPVHMSKTQNTSSPQEIFGSGSKINNTNIHIELSEPSKINKEESEILLSGTVNRILYPKIDNTTIRQQSSEDESNNLIMRTVSQQCSLEYSSGTDAEQTLEHPEFNVTQEGGNECKYSITDLSQTNFEDSKRSIYENPLHNIETSSTTTMELGSVISDFDTMDDHCCDDQEHPQSPVSASELDELYACINRQKLPQVTVHDPPAGYSNERRSRSPILFPPSISFESGLNNELEVNMDFRFNAQGVVVSAPNSIRTTSCKKLNTYDDSDTNSDDIKVETTV